MVRNDALKLGPSAASRIDIRHALAPFFLAKETTILKVLTWQSDLSKFAPLRPESWMVKSSSTGADPEPEIVTKFPFFNQFTTT